MRPEDIETLRAFYAANQDELFAYALARSGEASAAGDVIHGVFCRLLAASELPEELRPYVFRAIRNAAIDMHRADAVRERASAMLQTLNGCTPPERIAEQEEVAHWLTLLSEDEHEVVVLKIFSGLTFREIAEMRAVSANTAASWYRRGIEKIRNHIESESP